MCMLCQCKSRPRSRFDARDLNLVIAPATKGAALPFRVTGAEAYCFTFG